MDNSPLISADQKNKKKKKKTGKLSEEVVVSTKDKKAETLKKIAEATNEIDELFATAKKRKQEQQEENITNDNHETNQKKKKLKKDIDFGTGGYEPEDDAMLEPVEEDEEADAPQEYGIIQSKYKRTGKIINPEAPLHRVDKETGLPVYKAHLLRVGEGGGTPLCPFDCNCCF
jgi:hypothetical protein